MSAPECIVRSLRMGVALLCLLSGCARVEKHNTAGPAVDLSPSSMPRIGKVDERYQSYNIEMLEVTGGWFWKPYGQAATAPSQPPSGPAGETPPGMNPKAYAYRPPINLVTPRRRKLAAALGPAYVRVSGTWANTTYFPDSDQAPKAPPPGFNGVLTHQQWKGVVEFAHAVDAEIVSSFAISPGTRDASGAWTPEQARRFVAYTRSAGGRIAAAEFMNEPTFAAMGGAPPGYNAAGYGRDFKIYHAFARKDTPGMLILGPGSVGETTGDWGVAYGNNSMLNTRDLLAACAPEQVDGLSYHHYGATSQRCSSAGMPGTTAADALSEQWLRRTDQTLAFYQGLRDAFDPSKPMWLTETADAACGGNPWASTFLDSFRYLDQLGRLARQGVQVVMHNTLDASDYGLLDENTLEPRPDYWAALLWRKLMGTTVLDPGIPLQAGLHVYAHSLRGVPGGVALLVINTDRSATRTLSIPANAQRYTLSALHLQELHVQLNGKELLLNENDDLPELHGIEVLAGNVTFAPATSTFLTFPQAGNPWCR